MKPSALLRILGEPGTGGQLFLHTISVGHGEPYTGVLYNESKKIVGILNRFKFDFLEIDSEFLRTEAFKVKDTVRKPGVATIPKIIEVHPVRFAHKNRWR